MKKVRFETPDQGCIFTKMSDSECHSPRPVLERQLPSKPPEIYQCTRILPYSNDPIQRYECSNSSPYPLANKTCLPTVGDRGSNYLPSNDLELSMLDVHHHAPRQPLCKPILKSAENRSDFNGKRDTIIHDFQPVLSAVENKIKNPPNVLSRDNGFFIRRDNLNKLNADSKPLLTQFNGLSLDKENDPFVKKSDITRNLTPPFNSENIKQLSLSANHPLTTINQDCMCHHCIKAMQKIQCPRQQSHHHHPVILGRHNQCSYVPPPAHACCEPVMPACNCNNEDPSPRPMNALERKYKMMQMYEQSTECTDIEKQKNIMKEKREPTVSDLFKIIKLQNEQLQLLQEKVDKFLTGAQNVQTTQSSMDHRALQNEHKMSIGVMTSFEMVRTSTIINKEVVKQTNENSQIQCNRSQVSIKEVVSKSQPVNQNFLDGIIPVEKNKNCNTSVGSRKDDNEQDEVMNDEKTFNELSLHNVHVDNAITPLMSPDQSMYLDVQDYSDSEASCIDQSNVGWTYYNKIMTHVNGMLQDSDMPSSASALYRNTRQQCVQMQIDKANFSVSKRVKFGDDPLGIRQPHIYAASTDTSFKMNQLAAKYLRGSQPQVPQRPVLKTSATPFDMSFATKNYMERHKLLQDSPMSSRSPPPAELPRFLDITALKQQPKLI